MAKHRLAWFVTFACAALLLCSAASARTVSLGIRPPNATASGPIVSVETEAGETIEPTSLEVTSVLAGPLVVTQLGIHLEPTAGGEVRVQVPKGAAVLHSDCGENDDENTPPSFVSGVWRKRLGFLFSSDLSLTYVQPLLNGRAVVVSAGGHPRLSRLEATLTDQLGQEIAEPLVQTGADAMGDVVVEVSDLAEAYRAGDLAMIDLPTHRNAVEPIRDTIIAIDTSASFATAFQHVVERARSLARAVQGRLSVVAFDQTAEVLFEGPSQELPTSVFEKVEERGPLGATHLEHAFSAIERLVRKREYRRVVLLTDGRVTAGSRDRARLVSQASRWARLGARRLDFVSPEVERDEVLLEALVGAGFVDGGRVASLNDDPVHELEQKSATALPVAVVGAVSQRPWQLTPSRDGFGHWILVRIPESLPLTVRVGNSETRTLSAEAAWRPLLESYFEQQGLLASQATGSERKQLVIEDGKLEVAKRRRVVTRCSRTTVSGRLPPEAIQRIVRLNFGRFRGCAAQMHRAPIRPKGRVAVRFVIDLDGQVTSVSNAGSTVPERNFVQCVMQAFTELRFPPPEGGIVTVVYPLVFTDDRTKPPIDDANARSHLDDIPKQYVPVELQNPNYPLVPREVGTEAYLGEYRVVMQALAERRTNDAEDSAKRLLERQPNEPATYLAWGSVATARGDLTEARRAFGSLLDRFDDSAPLHRVAAAWLSQLDDPRSRALAVDALRSAIRFKVGRVETERQLAWLLAETGDYAGALQLMTAAFLHQESRQPSLLNQEIAMLAAALIARHPGQYEAVVAQLKSSGTVLAATPRLVFAIQNESKRGLALSIYTDTKSGVRFQGTPYSYSDRDHPSAYEISKEQRDAPYTLRVVDRGSDDAFEGQHTGLGHVRILDHDGHGQLRIELRPFVLQQLRGEVDLATYR